MIHFGTDGWRAVIAEGFTFDNVRLVAQATAEMVLEQHSGSGTPEVVIGYDTRFLSDRFGENVARVMAANGIIAWLSRTDAPTPSICYNVKARQASAGVVITASHNPPRYSGFKVKAGYGGSITAEDYARLEERTHKLIASGKKPLMVDYDAAQESGMIRRFDPSWVYYQHLTEFVDMDKISDRELRVVCDAMWGAGRGALSAILSRTRTRIEEIRGALNPGFGGIHPEPIQRNLNELTAAVSRAHADVGLATDGDADRIGAVDAQGHFVDPHVIYSLVLRHLVENKGQRGDVVKTISTTFMVDSMARQYGLMLHETPVGFNHIADLIMQKDILIGGEESGGITVRGHIPGGDGVLMGLLLLEVMGYARAPLHEIIADLQKQFGPAHYARNDVHLKQQVAKKEVVRRLQEAAPQYINGQAVTRINTLDGIKFYLADDSWLLVRPSGTEPVLRIYAEARSNDDVRALLQQGDAFGEIAIR
ncbi:MAG: phosphoglucomutase/phosphomannomutase family protein [Anaerolineae bacterium]|nr:phosphoglucomutase/phosphomannomutase family protein [Anaerolineae bacterium]